jgi:hypothetical protein
MSQLIPSPKFTALGLDADGASVPLVGGKLYSYIAGTSTPKDTYTSSTLGAVNANPVILDTIGQADVWLNGSYKFVLTDANDVLMWTVDNVQDVTHDQTFTNATLAGTLTITSTTVTWSGNPTHTGNHTFANNVTVNGNTILGDSSVDFLTVNPATVYWPNNPIQTGNHTWIGTQTHNAAVTFGAATFFNVVPTFNVNPDGRVIGDTYTPTLTGVSNVDSLSAAKVCQYIRVGKVVTVSGRFGVDTTAAASANTRVDISLPIASDLASTNQLAGTAASFVGEFAAIEADITNNRAAVEWLSNSTVSHDFTFTYVIL